MDAPVASLNRMRKPVRRGKNIPKGKDPPDMFLADGMKGMSFMAGPGRGGGPVSPRCRQRAKLQKNPGGGRPPDAPFFVPLDGGTAAVAVGLDPNGDLLEIVEAVGPAF